MILTTTDKIEDKKIISYIGIVSNQLPTFKKVGMFL